MAAGDRERRTAEADALGRRAWEQAGLPATGAALVAVGGYGRGELAPYSDLDLVLVHDDAVHPDAQAQQLWYPLWDSGARVDHAVRSVTGMAEAAREDLKVALGLLDVRHLAGDPNLTLRVRTELLATWRAQARRRTPELAALVRSRHELLGEVAHAAVPDLKEAAGGIRDTTVLRALVATWLVDVPHQRLDHCRRDLLDVRDHLHTLAGRATDRVAPEHWDDLAGALDLPDALAAQRHVRELGRRVAHLSDLTWRRVEGTLDRPRGRSARRPRLTPLGHGLARTGGEVVLSREARPAEDPTLLLRAAAEAAEQRLALGPVTATRLARECPALPEPWPAPARQLLVRLLTAGPGLPAVWESLDENGAVDRVLPEWADIRLLPHASPVHRFTVDRHVLETCVAASALIRQVARPDLLALAALLHDLGKGGLTDHSVAGATIAATVGRRWGLAEDDVALVSLLVRHHLLLPTVATTRDPDDPATAAAVAERVGSGEALALLGALTEADARATAPQAWSSWRAGLVHALLARTRAHLATAGEGAAAPEPPEPWRAVPADAAGVADEPGGVSVTVEAAPDDGSRVCLVTTDRVGLLAEAAAALAYGRVPVRAARAWVQGPYALSEWDVAVDPASLDPALLRQRLQAAAGGRLDVARRVAPPDGGGGGLEPAVVLHPEDSHTATVLEVRSEDRPGVVYRVCAALAGLDVAVRSAHVSTFGPQAVDVFYLQEPGAGALAEPRAAEAAHRVRAALRTTPTVGGGDGSG